MRALREILGGLLLATLTTLTILGGLFLAVSESNNAAPQPTSVAQVTSAVSNLPQLTSTPTHSATFTLTPQREPTGITPTATFTPAPTELPTLTPSTDATHLSSTPDAGCCVSSPTTSPTPTPCGPPFGWVSYIVKPGETLFGLSQRFGVSLQQLQLANCLSNPDLKYGQSLFVPFSPSPTPTATELPTEAPTPIPQPLIIANTSLFNVLRDPSRSNGAIARVHIEFTGGAPPYTFYDEGILQAGNPILALTECDGTLIHTVRVDSADGQSASQTYYISPVTCP